MNKKTKISILLSTSFALVVTLSGVASSWTPPRSTAPEGDTIPPINEGSAAQRKLGGLGVEGLASFGGATFTGKIQIKNGTQGEGRILVTDGVGNTRWVTPPPYDSTAACPDGSSKMADGQCGYEYTLVTGSFVSCSPGDELISLVDTCTGQCRNHGVQFVAPNGCYTWEGPKNYGGQSCTITCRGAVKICMKIVNGDAEWYLSGTDGICN